MPPHEGWPSWWGWDIRLTGHVLRHMIDRGFSETDLRQMLAAAVELTPDIEPGRWVVLSKWAGARWEVVLEPDPPSRRLVVITAYMVE